MSLTVAESGLQMSGFPVEKRSTAIAGIGYADSRMGGAGKPLMRWVGLLAVGAIALHELRYLVPGAHAHEALTAQAHSYLPLLMALIALVFVASVVDFVGTLLAARTTVIPARAPVRFRTAWATAALALIAMFFVQESLEGALVGGHTAGIHGLFGHGGWSVIVLAPLLGALIAFLVKGTHKAIELVARIHSRPRPRCARVAPLRPPVIGAPRLRPLACNLAGRGPPLFAD
jgi:hypothetical protein